MRGSPSSVLMDDLIDLVRSAEHCQFIAALDECFGGWMVHGLMFASEHDDADAEFFFDCQDGFVCDPGFFNHLKPGHRMWLSIHGDGWSDIDLSREGGKNRSCHPCR